jgi:hypothetical protein
MAFDISALANYTLENQDSLVVKTLFTAKTQDLIKSEGTIMADVKSAEQINVLDTDAIFQVGGTCGFNTSGTTAYTRRTLTIGKIKVNESLCPKTLERSYLQLKMKAGSRPTEIPFEEEYTGLKTGKMAEQLETGLWQGDTNSGNGNLNKFDGLIKIIDASGLAVGANATQGIGTATSLTSATSFVGVGTTFLTTHTIGDKLYTTAGVLIGTVASITDNLNIVLTANGAVAITAAAYEFNSAAAIANGGAGITKATGITQANVRAIINSMWIGLPQRLQGKSDVRVFVGWDVFNTYVAALINANLFAYTAENGTQASGEIMIPGTEYKLTAIHGLDTTNRIYAMRTSNLFMGCDILGEEDRWEIFYAKEADEVRFVTEFKLGVQVALPYEIVQFQLL